MSLLYLSYGVRLISKILQSQNSDKEINSEIVDKKKKQVRKNINKNGSLLFVAFLSFLFQPKNHFKSLFITLFHW